MLSLKQISMKRFYILLSLVSISLLTFSQAVLVEDFSSGQMPPAGWSVDGYSSQWSTSDSDNAGGSAPEGMFTWVQEVGISRLISPTIDLSEKEFITLRFPHYFDNYSGTDPKIGVATRSGSKGPWNIVWEEAPGGDVGPELKIIEISNDDVGANDFQFCFYVDGNMYNMDYWYIDDINLYEPYELDAELSSISTPSFVNGPTEVTGKVSNFSNNFIVSLEINWQVGEGDVHSTSITGLAIGTGESYDFTCDQLFDFPIGAYDLHVWIATVNGGDDDFLDNNSLTSPVSVVSYLDQRVPCFEEFTSSTCAPCASYNTQFVPWVANHADDITLVKYQMSWPGSGDPYYTEEGGDRRGYYGVSWVPWQVADGKQIETTIGAVNSFFDAAMVNPSFASVVGTHSINGTVIDITTTVLPFANFANNRVHIVVFENVTTQNTGNNGETEFHHVMMKMVPDADGTTVDFVDREPFTMSHQVDLAGTNVEEFDDLGVAIIVQDFGSQSIHQSAYSVEDAVFATEDRLNDVLLNGETVSGFDSDIYEYNIELPEGTTDIPLIEGIPMDDNATVIVVPATELPGTTIIDVFAEDLASHKRYVFNFTVQVGIDNPNAKEVSIYPNPSTGHFYISGIENALVSIYNITGKMVAEYKNSNGKINAQDLSSGIYFIKIYSDQNIITKRITINK